MIKKTFREYISINQQKNHLDLYIKCAGYTSFGAGESYPRREHPDEYFFEWEKGRILREYQLVFLSSGQGEFESSSFSGGKVKAGDVMMVFKGEWHRYRPDTETGWKEHWLGFSGSYAEKIISSEVFSKTRPIISIGQEGLFSEVLNRAISLLDQKNAGNESIVAAHVPVLLTILDKNLRFKQSRANGIEQIIHKCQTLLLENYQNEINVEEVAGELGVSYSWLRKSFKDVTGLAPHQYILKLRLQKARDLLAMTDKQIKEIAFECGFTSPFYFSKYFKKDRGISPAQYRNSRFRG